MLAVCEYLSKLGESCAPSEERVRPLVEAQIQSQLYYLLLGWIVSRVDDGVELGVQPEIAASYLSWALFGVGLQWSRNPSLGSAQELADQALLLMTRGCSLSI